MKKVSDLIPSLVDGHDLELKGWNVSVTINMKYWLLEILNKLLHTRVSKTISEVASSFNTLIPKKQVPFCGKNRNKVKKDGTTKEELPEKNYLSWIHKRSGWENIASIAEDMQTLALFEVAESEWCRSFCSRDTFSWKFYASHSNFQPNKKIVSGYNETDFSWKSAAHGQAYRLIVWILKERLIKRKEIAPLTETLGELFKERKIQITGLKNTRLERNYQVNNDITFSEV